MSVRFKSPNLCKGFVDSPDKSWVELIIRKPYENADKAQLSILGPAPGKYRIIADGKESIVENVEQLECSLNYGKKEMPVVIIMVPNT